MYTALEDINIENVDFVWISQTTKISHLKRAIRLIEADGDYFPELKDACYKRMQQIDPSLKRNKFQNQITADQQNDIKNQLLEWEKDLSDKDIFKDKKKKVNLENHEEYFENQNIGEESKIKQKKKAQRQRVKGNEALKSKDYQQAISYYSSSIKIDPQMYQSYSNRALVYLKQKEYVKCVEDSEVAIRLNPKYIKSYQRKSKGLIGLGKKIQAYRNLQEALKVESDNNEISKEMKELREDMTEKQFGQVQKKFSEFKKITIEQESDQDDN